MSLDDLPPLRESLAAHGLTADKAFGQHFLLDLNVTRKIARLAGPLEGHAVIEVGPGPGGLTRALLGAGARVIAIEKDARFLPILATLADAAPSALEVVLADALAVNELDLLARTAPGLPYRIVSNLPYNVGAPLLVKWLTGPLRPASMALMFQKEVAQRICAAPGSDAYGRLSVLTQAVCSAEVLMELPARAFTPAPKVDSAVVGLLPRPERPSAALLMALEQLTAAAFGQRRKMLRSSLKAIGGEALCQAVGVDATQRAEAIAVADFLAMAQRLVEARA